MKNQGKNQSLLLSRLADNLTKFVDYKNSHCQLKCPILDCSHLELLEEQNHVGDDEDNDNEVDDKSENMANFVDDNIDDILLRNENPQHWELTKEQTHALVIKTSCLDTWMPVTNLTLG